jgi:hypothetical protein
MIYARTVNGDGVWINPRNVTHFMEDDKSIYIVTTSCSILLDGCSQEKLRYLRLAIDANNADTSFEINQGMKFHSPWWKERNSIDSCDAMCYTRFSKDTIQEDK